jgi:hypothetical protein
MSQEAGALACGEPFEALAAPQKVLGQTRDEVADPNAIGVPALNHLEREVANDLDGRLESLEMLDRGGPSLAHEKSGPLP